MRRLLLLPLILVMASAWSVASASPEQTERPDAQVTGPQAMGTGLGMVTYVYFDHGRWGLDEKYHQTLDDIFRILDTTKAIRLLLIEGHTDPSEGKGEYARNISKLRAKAIYDYLVEKGIAKERLQHKGFGSDRPRNEGQTPKLRGKNRRVEFLVLDPAQMP